MEYKNFKFEIKEIKAEDDNFFRFKGAASTFEDMDRGQDIIENGSFLKSLKKIKPVLLWQHKMSEPLGVLDEIREESKILYVEGRMPKNDDFVLKRVIPQIEIGSIVSMSIGFDIVVSEYDYKTEIRRIKQLDLYEISLVSVPMNPNATISSFKSKEEIKTKYSNLYKKDDKNINLNVIFDNFNNLKDVSSFLKDFGFSNNETNSLMHNLKKVIDTKVDTNSFIPIKVAKEIAELSKHIRKKYEIHS